MRADGQHTHTHTTAAHTHTLADTEVANNRRNVLCSFGFFPFDQTGGAAPTSPTFHRLFPTSRTSQTHSFVKLNHMASGMGSGGQRAARWGMWVQEVGSCRRLLLRTFC